MTIINQKATWPPARKHRTFEDDMIALRRVLDSIQGNPRRERLFTAFKEFLLDNPEIVNAFEQFLFETIAAGKKVYSSDALFHRVRWWSEIETRKIADDFKLNNNHTAYLARFFMAAYPELLEVEFFRLRDPMPRHFQASTQ